MPLTIEDDATAVLVAELARRQGLSKQEAVKRAVQAALDETKPPLRERFAALRASHPLPAATDLRADKAFFDDLSETA
jgi:antitoxin VapB